MDVPDQLPVVFAGIWGAMLGSFLNVCVLRLPRNESVIVPGSHCPGCGKPIAWYDNIPLLSYVMLRARCRHCGAGISLQYPAIELAVALIWAGAVVWWGATWEALSAALLTTLLLGIALTDARHYLIPDEFSLGGLGAGLALSFAPGGISPLASLLGAAAGFALLWVVKAGGDWALAHGMIRGEELKQVLEAGEKPTTLGGGDLKMMAMVGSFLGWRGVLLTAFLGSVTGVVVFLPLLLMRRRRPIPFGVFLAAGAVATLIVGDALVAWYQGMLVSSVP